MFKRGELRPRQAELTLRNLDNHPTLQDNRYQLGIYGFGTHNATAVEHTGVGQAEVAEYTCLALLCSGHFRSFAIGSITAVSELTDACIILRTTWAFTPALSIIIESWHACHLLQQHNTLLFTNSEPD
jgi:hypothetical protein